MFKKYTKYISTIVLTISICFIVYLFYQNGDHNHDELLTKKDTISILKLIVEDAVIHKYNDNRLDTNNQVQLIKYPYIKTSYNISAFGKEIYFSNMTTLNTLDNQFCFLQFDINHDEAQIEYSLSGWAKGYVELKKDKNWKITRHVINDL